MAPTVSVIVTARDAAPHIGRCLSSVLGQHPPVHELIVVDDGSRDGTASTAEATGCRVLRLGRPSRGRAEAGNAGAAVASGDVLAFLASHAVAERGWAAGLAARAGTGAALLAGGIACREPASTVEWFARRLPHGHDLDGSGNGFLPSASLTNLAVSRALFQQLGGFDPALAGGEDDDLCFRAQMHGHDLVAAPEAAVTHGHPRDLLRLARSQASWHRARPLLRWKYRRCPFQAATRRTEVHPLTVELARSVASAALLRDGSARRLLATPALDAWRLASRRAGLVAGHLDLVSGWRGVPVIREPANAVEPTLSAALAPRPAALIVGYDSRLLRLLAPAAMGMAVPPPGLAGEALARWDDPSPWSMRIARLARARGWRLPVELSARRLEQHRPRTWGESYLTLHAVDAWLQGRLCYAVAGPGAAGAALARRLPDVPIVVVGAGSGADMPRRPALVITRARLYLSPGPALAQVAELAAAATSAPG